MILFEMTHKYATKFDYIKRFARLLKEIFKPYNCEKDFFEMEVCIGEVLGFVLGAILKAACELAINDCCNYCCDKSKESKEKEDATQPLITKQPLSEESDKQIVSQKIYNTTGIDFTNKMSLGFSNSYN